MEQSKSPGEEKGQRKKVRGLRADCRHTLCGARPGEQTQDFSGNFFLPYHFVYSWPHSTGYFGNLRMMCVCTCLHTLVYLFSSP